MAAIPMKSYQVTPFPGFSWILAITGDVLLHMQVKLMIRSVDRAMRILADMLA